MSIKKPNSCDQITKNIIENKYIGEDELDIYIENKHTKNKTNSSSTNVIIKKLSSSAKKDNVCCFIF